MFLLDTNAVSEIRKIQNGTANKNFENWFLLQKSTNLFSSDIVMLEIQQGILKLRHKKDFTQAQTIECWFNGLPTFFDEQILPVTRDICLTCAKLHIPNPRPAFDSLIAATALVHDLTLVTRNEKDFLGIDDLRIINPFQ